MLNQKKIVVVMPAYNAAATLERTYREIPHDIVDDVGYFIPGYPTDETLDERQEALREESARTCAALAAAN